MSSGNESDTSVTNRVGYIGGSDAAALLGLSPWSTPLQVFADKQGMGLPRVTDPNQAQQFFFGNAVENAIAEGVARFHGIKARRFSGLLRAKRPRSFMGGHIDFLVDADSSGIPTFLECKNIRFAGEEWGDHTLDRDGSGKIPRYYLAQCDHYMYVMDSNHCYLAALIGGCELRVYLILRSPLREAILLEAEDDLWHRLQEDDPPIGKSYDDFCLALQLGYIKELSAKEAKKQDPLILNEHQTILVREFQDVNKKAVKLSKEAKDKRKEIIETLGGKLGYFCDIHGEELGSLFTQSRRGLDKELLRIEKPEVYALYERKSIFPKLKVKGVEEDE